MRPEMSVCADKMSMKNDLGGTLRLHAHARAHVFIIGQQQKPVISPSS